MLRLGVDAFRVKLPAVGHSGWLPPPPNPEKMQQERQRQTTLKEEKLYLC
jgi:hypothetical protein